ncbi:hypothetical protein KQI84_12520 [bacterium]|nr:hypothetical protein [bacterium]
MKANVSPEIKATPKSQYFIYAAYLLGMVSLVILGFIRHEGDDLRDAFREDGLVEVLESVNFTLAAILLGIATVMAWKADRRIAYPMIFLTSAALWAANREMDGVWEGLELDIVYDTLRVAFALPGLAVAIFKFKDCWSFYRSNLKSAPIIMMHIMAGGYILAQIAGKTLATLDAPREYKRATEESIEGVAGTFLLFAAIELIFFIRRELRAKR